MRGSAYVEPSRGPEAIMATRRSRVSPPINKPPSASASFAIDSKPTQFASNHSVQFSGTLAGSDAILVLRFAHFERKQECDQQASGPYGWETIEAVFRKVPARPRGVASKVNANEAGEGGRITSRSKGCFASFRV